MNTRLVSPTVVAVLALILGLLVGPAWFWFRSADLVTDAIVSRRLFLAQKEQQQRVQGWDYWTIEIENLSAELKGEKERLQKQTDELDQREARLASEKQELVDLRAELESMRQQLDNRVIAIGTDEAKNLRM